MVTWRCTATAMAALCGAGLACSPGAERQAAITSVDPPAAYNDVGRMLVIAGRDFRPSYEFDTVSGAASVKAGFSGMLVPVDPAAGLSPVAIDPVSWQEPGELHALLPAGLPAGVYEVRITDPRGDVIKLSPGFTSLGEDVDPPFIVVGSPLDQTIVGAGTEQTVTLSASDGAGALTELTWSVLWSDGTKVAEGTCNTNGPPRTVPCSFRFTAPTPARGPEPLFVNVAALDSKGNHGSDTVPLLLAPRPRLTELSPGSGKASGGTLLFVTGTNFVPDNEVSRGTVVVVDGEALVTEFESETQLRATTLPHDPPGATVSVRTGGAESARLSFGFFAAPLVKAIEPASGPEAGGNLVVIVGKYFRKETQIYFSHPVTGSEPLRSFTYISPSRIEGLVPPGVGIVNVVGFDAIGGIGPVPGTYVYESGQ